MRHGKKINHLGRKAAHRKAMLANMACSLIAHKRINTTVAKAKALRKFVEPLITKSREDTTHNRRIVFSRLRNKYAVTELFRDVAVKVGERPGGYTRIIKLGNRLGDNAEMAMIELVDYNETYTAGKPEKKKSTRRSRRRRGSAAEADTAPTDVVVEEDLAKAEEDTAVVEENVAVTGEDTALAEENTDVVEEDTAVAEEDDVPATEEATTSVEEDVAVTAEDTASTEEDAVAAKEEATPVAEDVTAVEENTASEEEDIAPVAEDVTPEEDTGSHAEEDTAAEEEEKE